MIPPFDSNPTPRSEAPTDHELVQLVRTGSVASFETIVLRYEDRLLRFLCRRVANRHDAEDLLQETFVRAYRHLDTYNSRWPMRTWLFTIAARLAASHYRRKPSLVTHDMVLERVDSMAADPSDAMACDEQSRQVWDMASKSLTDDQYMALWLRYVEEMPVRDVARVMGKTVTHVKVLLHRARRAMLKRLQTSEDSMESTGRLLRPAQSRGGA